MPVLFGDRKIVDEFKTRNVVFESNAHIARNGDLIIRAVVEFGNNGSIKRQAIINTDAQHTFSVATSIGEYQSSVLEIIDALECFSDWLKGDKAETFSMFLDQEHPLYFHGRMVKDKISFSAFGPNLNNLELKCNNTRSVETTPFSERIAALAQAFRDHLKDVDSISIDQIIKGQLNKSEQAA